jgi:hypothetical protein
MESFKEIIIKQAIEEAKNKLKKAHDEVEAKMREMNLYEFKATDEEECKIKVLKYLTTIEETKCQENKLVHILNMFHFISSQKEYLFKDDVFKNIVKRKLLELFYYKNWDKAQEIYNELFGDNLL